MNKRAAIAPLPRSAAEERVDKNMTGAVSDQLIDLNAEVKELLAKFKTLIENRSAWADGVEGCREGVVLLGGAQNRLQVIVEATRKVESDLASARSELERWSKMHAELATVERDLRAECDRYREAHANLEKVERALRADCDKKRAALEKQTTSLANVRALAEEMIRETSS